MNLYQKIFTFFLLLVSTYNYAQLGFCTGSKGDPIFTEHFGSGYTYGPALPTGTTNYTYISGAPNDGFYTLFYKTNLYSTWHFAFDHTPDIIDGIYGKALIVNANANNAGEFYKRKVTGLCINTTFEFSAWVMNIYNPNSGFCGANEKPVNVRFEIWNDTQTVLLSSGNTGDIIGTSTAIWKQYGLVFTTTNQTSVVLIMKNNGLGGCGNDLAIDDIEFRSCGELTTITNSLTASDSYIICQDQSPVSTTLQASTSGAVTYFYQWQSSPDGINWNDIAGATTPTYVSPNINTQIFYRAKAAQDAANLSNNFCSTSSNIFNISFLKSPNNCVSNGDSVICSNEAIPSLSVSTDVNTGVNWYDAPVGGNLLKSNSTIFTPLAAGIFYAEAYDLTTNCISVSRTAVSLTIEPLPTATISGTTNICSGNSAVISFNGTPNAIVNYKVDSGANQIITLNSSGKANITTPILTTNSTYSLVSVSSPVLSSCIQTLKELAVITVNAIPFATIIAETEICSGDTAVIIFSGTPDATVTYVVNSGSNQTIVLNSIGEAIIFSSNLSAKTTYNLISVSSSGLNNCTQILSQSYTISVVPLPTATVSAIPLSVCSGQNSTLNFNGTPNAIVNYSENGTLNKTITLNAVGVATVSIQNITQNTTYQLISVADSNPTNCIKSLSESVLITLKPIPTASFTGDINYCSDEPLAITLTSDIVGTTFTWTVTQNGTTGAFSGSGNQINQVLTVNKTKGAATYLVTPVYNGCTGNVIEIKVTIYPLPIPTLTDGVICLNSGNTSAQPYNLNTNLNSSEYSFVWYYEGNIIPNAKSNNYDAYQIGSYSVIATNILTGCVSNPVFATVTESVKAEQLIIKQSENFSDNPSITVTVVGGEGPFLYKLDYFSFQTSNVFYNVSSGTHIITVVDQSFCTDLNATVTIINYPHFFTPNNDGYNDTWNIKDVVANSRIEIFDRYGKLIKEIKTNSNGWDGSYNGKSLPSSDYWFVLYYIENGVETSFKSHFSLKR